MAKCGACGEEGHTAKRHEVPCRICGQTKNFPLDEVSEMRDVYKCSDVEAHEKARRIWDLSHSEVQRLKAHGIRG